MASTTDPEHELWFARWREGRIRFHEGQPNTFLVRHVARLGRARRVFVPLCGKAEDLAFLAAQGHTVIGIELAEPAVREFFAEHELSPTRELRGPFTAYTAGAITLLAGDVFGATPGLVGAVDAYYDRAALIALPPATRARYVPHVRALLAPGAPGLVITLEHDQPSGPPYSVGEAELRTLYAGCAIERLDTRRAALLEATETIFAVTAA